MFYVNSGYSQMPNPSWLALSFTDYPLTPNEPLINVSPSHSVISINK